MRNILCAGAAMIVGLTALMLGGCQNQDTGNDSAPSPSEILDKYPTTYPTNGRIASQDHSPPAGDPRSPIMPPP